MSSESWADGDDDVYNEDCDNYHHDDNYHGDNWNGGDDDVVIFFC